MGGTPTGVLYSGSSGPQHGYSDAFRGLHQLIFFFFFLGSLHQLIGIVYRLLSESTVTEFSRWRSTRWLQVVLILRVGRSANNSFSIISSRHFNEKFSFRRGSWNMRLLFFFNIICCDWCVNTSSGAPNVCVRVGACVRLCGAFVYIHHGLTRLVVWTWQIL
jgi:hypothetical protein